MIRIDFYVLPSDSPNARQVLACQLTEKAYRLGHSICIYTESATQNRVMDDLLWTFRAGSFIPHNRAVDNAPDSNIPVILSHDVEPSNFNDILINLNPEVPKGFNRFTRLIELVNQNKEIRNAGRKRYRYYQKQGLEIETHKIDPTRV